MTVLGVLIPAALFLGALGLAAFLWSLKSGQYDDLDGAAVRILDEENDKAPPREKGQEKAEADGDRLADPEGCGAFKGGADA